MKKIIAAFTIASVFLSCGGSDHQASTDQTSADSTAMASDTLYFGEKITADNAIIIADLPAQLEGKDSVEIKLMGTIDEVCQKKGCWMNVAIDDESAVFVKFKDYEFFVPKDAAGKEVIIEGMAYVDTTSVEELKHYAMDAGESDSVVNAITEPEIGYNFMAKGVIINEKE